MTRSLGWLISYIWAMIRLKNVFFFFFGTKPVTGAVIAVPWAVWVLSHGLGLCKDRLDLDVEILINSLD